MSYSKIVASPGPSPSSPFAGAVCRSSDGAFIPADPRNVDWQSYQTWLTDGNLPEEPPPPSHLLLEGAIRDACDAEIARGFSSSAGRSMRGSMTLWLGAVLAKSLGGAVVSEDDAVCLAMAPKLNEWESAMLTERDRLLSTNQGVADARWPALPEGAGDFIASCDKG